MLTVKHIERNGREHIHTCDNVVWVPDNGNAESFGNAGLYLDVDCELDLSGQYPLDARIAIPVNRCGSPNDRAKPEVFIMNKFGSTVARYAL
jgi:hypothetical protein